MPYNPSNGTLSNKPYSPTSDVPTDGRSYVYDTINFKWRMYQSTVEALAELNTATKRGGRSPIWINVGGTLNNDGTFTGGVPTMYIFRDGVADGNLVECVTLTNLELQNKISSNTNVATATAHVASTTNPHGVTKAQVGLGSVDNTSDAGKPISSATATALAAKADLSSGKVPAGQLPVVNLASTDFTGDGGTVSPYKVNTGAILSYLQSLPGYANDPSLSLKADFTWGTSGSSNPQLSTPSLTIGTPTSSAIPLSWAAVTDATAYTVDRSVNNTTWTNIYSGSGTSYTSSGLTGSTLYYYRLRATAPGFTSSLYSTGSGTTASSGSSPAYLTWTPGADMEVYNTAKGMRKKTTGTAGWDSPSLAACESQAVQTFASGDKLIVKIDNASLATAIIVTSSTTPNMNPSISGVSYGIYTGAGLAAVGKFIQASSQDGVAQISLTSGDLLRITYNFNMLFEQSTDNGATWTTVFTGTIPGSGAYNIFVQSYSPLGGYSEIYKA